MNASVKAELPNNEFEIASAEGTFYCGPEAMDNSREKNTIRHAVPAMIPNSEFMLIIADNEGC